MTTSKDSTTIAFRVDKGLKTEAEALFAGLGINMGTALTMFLTQAVREQGLPFRPNLRGDRKKGDTTARPEDVSYKSEEIVIIDTEV